jgi:hypothetical protein
MYNSNKSTLSKDTFFKVQSSKTSINSINSTSPEELSVAKAKKALQKMLNKNSSSLFSVTKRVEV